MWPPRLRRQAATRTLKLSPTFLQVARGTCCTYSVTCLFKASSVLGLALYTSSFAAPHSQKSRGFRSGLWGAHSTSLFSAINLPGNSSFRYLIVPWAVWGGAPSCWYQAWRNWRWDKIPRKSLWKLLTGTAQRWLWQSYHRPRTSMVPEGHVQRWRRRRRSLSCLSVASLQFLQVERSPKNVIVIVYSAVEVKMRLIREPYEAHQVGMGL